MKRIYFSLFLLLVLTIAASAQDVFNCYFFSPIYNGGHQLPILATGDVDGDQKPELVIGSEYMGCVSIIDADFTKSVAPKPFTYEKGEISLIISTDLNQNGINEIIIGHEYTFNFAKDPSLFILEKRNNEYQVVWESGYLGNISRFFLQNNKVVIFVDDEINSVQRLHLLQYQDGEYKITDSMNISGYPVYLGKLGNLTNSIVLCSTTEIHGRIYKFGTYVDNISLKGYTLIDFSTGHFKSQKPTAIILPEKDIWDFACYDLNQDGQDELILGTYDQDISIVEIYQWTSKGYQQVFSTKTPSKRYAPKGFILLDHDGNQIKEVLTVDGIMIHSSKDKYIAKNYFSHLHLDSVLEMANILACDLNQDNVDEIILFVARDTEDFQLYNTYEAYYLTTPAQSH